MSSRKNDDDKPHDALLLLKFSAGSLAILGIAKIYTRFLRRIPNADHVTPAMFSENRVVKGIVTSVGDADGFRLYHTPGVGWSRPFKVRRVPSRSKDLKDKTISIRIAGVDAPEGAHFGRPAQLFAAESHAWLKDKILSKKVHCQLLHRDQYSRIVANVQLPGFFPKNLALEMLRAGWATTYEQASARYGEEGKEAYLAVEKEAKAKRRGMWKRGTQIETPAEYKRKYAQPMADGEQSGPQKDSSPKGSSTSWLRCLWLR